jgi:hypothetical protein
MSLCLIKHHVMKTFVGMEVQLLEFSTSALDGGEWSAACPVALPLGKNPPPPGTPWVGGCVGLIDGLDAVVKRKICASAGNRTPVLQLIA